jgi:hypothetical protein
MQYAAPSRLQRRSLGLLDAPLELVIGLAEGETRWRGMAARMARGILAPGFPRRLRLDRQRVDGAGEFP